MYKFDIIRGELVFVVKGDKGETGETGATGAAGTNGTDGASFVWEAAYVAETNYSPNDVVSYNGSSYICILASTGNLPTNATYWSLMAQAGAGAVTSVNGADGVVVLDSDDIDDTDKNHLFVSSTEKSTWNGKQAALGFTPENTANKGQANGYCPLGADSKIASTYLPPIAITSTSVVASEVAQLALTAQEGDVAVRSELKKSYIHNGGTAGTMADWTELQTPTDTVLSVNGKTGTVSLTYSDVGAAATLGADDNYVTGAEKIKLSNLSNTNTGDETTSTIRAKLGQTSYGGVLLAADYNLDNIAVTGFYTCYGTSSNVPSASYSWFIAHQNSNVGNISATQRAVAYSSTLIVYERMKINSSWGTWVKQNVYTDAEQTKLSGIATGAQVNNISDANATDLTDGGATTLHKHSYTNLDDKPTIPTAAAASNLNTGTDTTKFVTSDALAGSNLGIRYISQIAVGANTSLTVADGVGMDMIIPPALTGMNLVYAQAYVDTAGTTNATTIQIHNVTDNTDMLSTNISIASGGRVGTAGTVNTSYDDVATNDLLRIDCDAISVTSPKGLTIILGFQLP